LLLESEQVTPGGIRRWAGNTGVDQTFCDRGDLIGRRHRHLGDVSDRDAPAIAEFLCEVADIVNVHVDIVFACQLEDAAVLSVIVGIVSGCGINTARPPVDGLNRKIVGVGDLREPFLRESADFNINGSSVILRRLHDILEGDQAGGRIDFDMGPHSGGTIHDTFLQGTAGALMDVLNRETAFCFRDSGRVIGWAGLRLRRASTYYAGFVEMNVRLHHTRCGEFTGQVQLFAHRLKGLSDGRDLAFIYENIERAIALASYSIRIS